MNNENKTNINCEGRNYLKEELIQISKVSNSRLLKMK